MEAHPHNKTDQSKHIILVHGPIIIGAGPSGLATSACLSSRGVPSLILERSDSIASLWKSKTYDRLKLHLPKHFCRLPLLDFPEYFPKYPSKNEFLAYLESYASHFRVVPRFNQNVQNAAFDSSSGFWRVKTHDNTEYLSKWLIVATGENADPYFPEIPGRKKFSGGKIVHASEYKSGEEFRRQKVLVVGCGNSGMEISLDLVRHNASPHLVVRNTVSKNMFFHYIFEISLSFFFNINYMLPPFHVGSCVAKGDTWAVNIWSWDDTSQMLTLKAC